MEILHLTSDYLPNPLWGMGWHVKSLVDFLRKKGIKVYVGTSSKSIGFEKNIISTNFETDKKYLSNNPYEIFNDFKKFLKWEKELSKEIIKKGIFPHIIHCHNWMSWLTTLNIKERFPSTKIISTFHFLQKQYEKMLVNPIPKFHKEIVNIEKEMIEKSDILIVQSKTQFDLIKDKYGISKDLEKIKIIPSGIKIHSTKSFKEISKKKESFLTTITFVGRIEKDKGVFQILEAFSLLNKKYKNLRLHIVGKGPELEKLKNIYKDNHIIFHGFLSKLEVEKILEKTHIFCMPSLSESFGNSVLEAMMFGAVPIFSEGKTVPSLFEENVHGLKIPLYLNKNNPIDIRNLTSKMELLIENKNLRKKMSQKAYNFSRINYSIKNAEKILNIYEKIKND